ncbi:MAG: Clp protease N-terminal domain-containing protein, partial [Hyphomicrobium sp.]
MAYRGDDMDLRTPQAPAPEFASSPADPFTAHTRSRTPSGPRSAPIWVDDTLLDCCNHAYDVASAHRAAEVRLEHLIYALTRIEEAAEALEARGVRIASLRREAATVIATEIPPASSNGKTNPRRSDAVEEVLRVAASHAYRRQSPAGIADVAFALFDSGLEFQTLLRGIPAGVRAVETGLDLETFRERPGNGPATHAARGLAADLAVTTQPSRIDALEHALRTLTIEIANERKILSGVLQDLQRELMAQREDTSRPGGIAHDKMQAVFGDRLHSLEQAFVSVRNNGGDAGGLQDRLGLLERALQGEISVTRAAVEALADKPALDLAPLLTRLETIETAAATERERIAEGLRSL